jgi:indole-3-glycerol phosphate synthase
MDVLVEVHDGEELGRAKDLLEKQAISLREPGKQQRPSLLLGINNRNLRTFEVSLDTTLSLRRVAPPDCRLVTESGILASSDVAKMRMAGIEAFLVGESLMREADPGTALQRLFFDA